LQQAQLCLSSSRGASALPPLELVYLKPTVQLRLETTLIIATVWLLVVSAALQAQLSVGTSRGASALPRLTLRRVRSVGRWNHNGEAGTVAAAAAAAGVSDEELSPAAQMILKAGE
jgi:hypothetical protein